MNVMRTKPVKAAGFTETGEFDIETRIPIRRQMGKSNFAAVGGQNSASGFAASHPLKPGSGLDKTCCTLEMSSDVSSARVGPGKFLAEPD